MTSFDTFESSQQGSRPVELYTFALGSVAYLFTSAEDPIVLGADTYAAESIKRDRILNEPNARNEPLGISLPATNSFVSQYVSVVPGTRASCTIVRLQRSEVPTFATRIVIFKGFVASAAFPGDGTIARLAVKSLEASLAKTIPRYTYQGLCGHVLYDTECGVNSNLFKVTGSVSAMSGNVMTLPAAAAKPDGYFNGGFVRPVGISDFRLILSHVGSSLTLLLPFPVAVTGLSVEAYAGCNHDAEGDCSTKFNNVVEHGGFPFVPFKNPFATGL